MKLKKLGLNNMENMENIEKQLKELHNLKLELERKQRKNKKKLIEVQDNLITLFITYKKQDYKIRDFDLEQQIEIELDRLRLFNIKK